MPPVRVTASAIIRGIITPHPAGSSRGPPPPRHMARDRHHPKQQNMRARIAAAAARLIAEGAIDDYAAAKRKAARSLGATDTHAMPGNDEVEAELRVYQSLYQADEQPARIATMRATALEVMEALAAFRPHLTGPVLAGTAARFADIDLQAAPEDPKAMEVHLINLGIDYSAETNRHPSRGLVALRFDWNGIPVRLVVLSPQEERNLPRAGSGGRGAERAGIDVVRGLVATGAGATS